MAIGNVDYCVQTVDVVPRRATEVYEPFYAKREGYFFPDFPWVLLLTNGEGYFFPIFPGFTKCSSVD